MKPTVVNLNKSKYDVYIGRPSQWGNPFTIDVDGDRDEVVKKYREYLWERIKEGKISIQDLLSLSGKTLGCFCKPKKCHGDILASAVEWAEGKYNEQNINQ